MGTKQGSRMELKRKLSTPEDPNVRVATDGKFYYLQRRDNEGSAWKTLSDPLNFETAAMRFVYKDF